eukprot:scaffold664_cov260-Pinguiococcus_pyrenoidosus.AAC.20
MMNHQESYILKYRSSPEERSPMNEERAQLGAQEERRKREKRERPPNSELKTATPTSHSSHNLSFFSSCFSASRPLVRPNLLFHLSRSSFLLCRATKPCASATQPTPRRSSEPFLATRHHHAVAPLGVAGVYVSWLTRRRRFSRPFRLNAVSNRARTRPLTSALTRSERERQDAEVHLTDDDIRQHTGLSDKEALERLCSLYDANGQMRNCLVPVDKGAGGGMGAVVGSVFEFMVTALEVSAVVCVEEQVGLLTGSAAE